MKIFASASVLQIGLLLVAGCSGPAAQDANQDAKIADAAYERLYNESVVRSNGFENVKLTRLKALHQEFERRQKDRDPGAAKWFREQMDEMEVQTTATP